MRRLMLILIFLCGNVIAQAPAPIVIPPGTYTITTSGPLTLMPVTGPAPVVPPAPDARTALESAAKAEWVAAVAAEATSTMPPSGDMTSVLALAPLRGVAARAIQSGRWSDPDTWAGRVLPTGVDLAWVMPGRTVTLDSDDALARTLRVSGTLAFPPDTNSVLTVQTLVNDASGAVLMGTPNRPIDPLRSARVVYLAMAPRDAVADPGQFGLGFISLGKLSVHGAPVTPFVAAAGPALLGSNSVTLASTPDGWKPDDTLIVAGTAPVQPSQDERVTVTGVKGAVVSFSPSLRFDHAAPDSGALASTYGKAPPGPSLAFHVANLTRNVSFSSVAASPIASRGHTMVMSADTSIAYASFTDGGRTDKSRVIDPITNPRARYPLHFHRIGPGSGLIPVVGNVVDGSPGWGLVNHSSNVAVSGNVVTACVGAGLVSEASDERGSFAGNLAMGMPGYLGVDPQNLRVPERIAVNDWGFSGHGLWMQSPYVTLSDNIAAGCNSVAVVHYPSDIAAVPAPLDKVTVALNTGTTVYGSRYGLYYYESAPPTPSQLAGLTAWGLQHSPFGMAYSGGVALAGFRWVGPGYGAGVSLDNSANVSYASGYAVGFDVGIEPGAGGPLNSVVGCYLHGAVADVLVEKTHNDFCASLGTRVVSLAGNTFAGAGLDMDGKVAPLSPAPQWFDRYSPESITLDGRQVYYAEQAPALSLDAPLTKLNGLTNAQALVSFGIAYAGQLSPPEAVPTPGVTGGLVGPPKPPPPGPLVPGAANFYRDGSGLVDLMWLDPEDPSRLIQQTVRATDLKPGWLASFLKDAKGRDRVGFRLKPAA